MPGCALAKRVQDKVASERKARQEAYARWQHPLCEGGQLAGFGLSLSWVVQFPAKCAGETILPPPPTPKRKDSVATMRLGT